MIKLYIQQIKEGKMTINDVPIKWREAVRRALEE